MFPLENNLSLLSECTERQSSKNETSPISSLIKSHTDDDSAESFPTIKSKQCLENNSSKGFPCIKKSPNVDQPKNSLILSPSPIIEHSRKLSFNSRNLLFESFESGLEMFINKKEIETAEQAYPHYVVDDDMMEFLSILSLSCHSISYEPGEFIIRRGDPGLQIYFVGKGIVDVISENDTTVIASIHQGGFFGEISLLFRGPRTASLKAASHCDIFKLEPDDAVKLLENFPKLFSKIKNIAENRLQELRKISNNSFFQDHQHPSPHSSKACPEKILKKSKTQASNGKLNLPCSQNDALKRKSPSSYEESMKKLQNCFYLVPNPSERPISSVSPRRENLPAFHPERDRENAPSSAPAYVASSHHEGPREKHHHHQHHGKTVYPPQKNGGNFPGESCQIPKPPFPSKEESSALNPNPPSIYSSVSRINGYHTPPNSAHKNRLSDQRDYRSPNFPNRPSPQPSSALSWDRSCAPTSPPSQHPDRIHYHDHHSANPSGSVAAPYPIRSHPSEYLPADSAHSPPKHCHPPFSHPLAPSSPYEKFQTYPFAPSQPPQPHPAHPPYHPPCYPHHEGNHCEGPSPRLSRSQTPPFFKDHAYYEFSSGPAKR